MADILFARGTVLPQAPSVKTGFAAILLSFARPAIMGSTAHGGARGGGARAACALLVGCRDFVFASHTAPPNIGSQGGAGGVIAVLRRRSLCRGARQVVGMIDWSPSRLALS